MVAADPVDIRQPRRFDSERGLWPDHDAPALGLEADDVKRLGRAADLEAAALADGEMDQAAMLTKDAAGLVDDIAAGIGLRPELLDQAGIIAVRNEADVLAVGLGCDAK